MQVIMCLVLSLIDATLPVSGRVIVVGKKRCVWNANPWQAYLPLCRRIDCSNASINAARPCFRQPPTATFCRLRAPHAYKHCLKLTLRVHHLFKIKILLAPNVLVMYQSWLNSYLRNDCSLRIARSDKLFRQIPSCAGEDHWSVGGLNSAHVNKSSRLEGMLVMQGRAYYHRNPIKLAHWVGLDHAIRAPGPLLFVCVLVVWFARMRASVLTELH